MSKILIVEDEIKLREELKLYLINNGYEVSVLIDFNDALNNILKTETDLILLDIGLPNINGEFLCKEIRKNSSVPIIIVTSRSTDIDELVSINNGADDFITKPYNPQILIARIESILRRNQKQTNYLEYKNIKIDISRGIIITDNENIELSKNELKIFYFLLKNRGKIVSRDEIMDYLWDSSMFVDDNTLTVNINRLRNKLEDLGLSNVIETRRGQGYIIL